MALTVDDFGSGNVVVIDDAERDRGNGHIVLRGGGNELTVGAPDDWGAPHIILESNARVWIGPGCVLGGLFLYAGPGADIRIGAATGFSGASSVLAHEATCIVIGEDCLIGSDTHLLGSDMHSVLDLASGRRINPARDILIGDHVWVGFRAVILKGSKIGPGAVIGAGAVVAGDVAAHCAVAGNPARVVREGVTWNISLLPT